MVILVFLILSELLLSSYFYVLGLGKTFCCSLALVISCPIKNEIVLTSNFFLFLIVVISHVKLRLLRVVHLTI